MSRDLARKIKLYEDEAAAKLPNMNPVMWWSNEDSNGPPKKSHQITLVCLDSAIDLQVIELMCEIHRQETLPPSNLNTTHDAKISGTGEPDLCQTFEQQN